MKIAVLGRTHLLLEAAEQAAQAGHTVVLVVTAAATPEYRVGPQDFQRFAERMSAPCWINKNLNAADTVEAVRALAPEVGISVNWPSLLRQDLIGAFPHGVLNCHAGDLPRYRGNACPNWAILNGEHHMGLCIHAMDPNALDAGPVYMRRRMLLTEETYIADAYAWCDANVPGMFVETLERMGDPSFAPQNQGSAIRPLRTFPRRPDDGLIRWDQDAAAVSRLVRASSRPFAGAFAYLEGALRVIIWRARPVELDYDLSAIPGQIIGRAPDGAVIVACGKGVLELEEVETANGSHLPATNRYRFRDQLLAPASI